jgi:hypothetical protein
MPVQDVRLPDVSFQGDVRGEIRPEAPAAPRPAAVDAVRWGATLMTQLGLDPRASNQKRQAA